MKNAAAQEAQGLYLRTSEGLERPVPKKASPSQGSSEKALLIFRGGGGGVKMAVVSAWQRVSVGAHRRRFNWSTQRDRAKRIEG